MLMLLLLPALTVEEEAEVGEVGGLLDVGVLADNQGALAAELEGHCRPGSRRQRQTSTTAAGGVYGGVHNREGDGRQW